MQVHRPLALLTLLFLAACSGSNGSQFLTPPTDAGTPRDGGGNPEDGGDIAPVSITTEALPGATVGVPFQAALEASGGTPAYAWSVVDGTLPAGLSLSTGGELSGTPATRGTSAFTVEARDSVGASARRSLGLEVVSAALRLDTASLPDAYVQTAYSASLSATGGVAPYTWVLASGVLAPGLTLSSEGALSGTPSSTGGSVVAVRVTDAAGDSATGEVSLTTYAPPGLTPVGEASAYVGQSFEFPLLAHDGKPPYTFLTPNVLPSWLQLSSDGRFQGTSPATGTLPLIVNVRDANGRTGSDSFKLVTYTLPAITPVTLPSARVGVAYSRTLAATGGRAPLAWDVTSGALPSGLMLSASGVLFGTPTAAGAASFRVRVTDSNGRTALLDLSLTVLVPPLVTTSSLPEGTVGQSYSVTLGVSGGTTPLTWSFTGTLPPGLTLGASTGVLSGTPTAAGTSSFTVTVRDALGDTNSRALSVNVSGVDVPFTVGQWNIEWFGADNLGPPDSTSDGGTPDDLQIAYASQVLGGDAGVNVWGLGEMVDSSDFETLKSLLPRYSGFLSNDTAWVPGGSSWYHSAEQKLGILYDSTLSFQSAKLILTAYNNDFGGRPPMQVNFTTRIHGVNRTLIVIIVHMKAFDDEVSYGQRQRAGAALKDYLDASLPSERVLVIGDWNDDVDRSITKVDGGYLASPYEPFVLDSANYTFVTRPLSLAGQRSTVSHPDIVDHSLASDEVMVDYVTDSARVLRPDQWLTLPAGKTYGNVVSDHFPVISRYDFGATMP